MKFYDMLFSFLIVLSLIVVGGVSYAGNDPVGMHTADLGTRAMGGGGNDPVGIVKSVGPRGWEVPTGPKLAADGGGHDPAGKDPDQSGTGKR